MRRIAAAAAALGLLLCGCSVQEVDERTPVVAAAWDSEQGGKMTVQTVSISAEETIPKTQQKTIPADSARQAIDQSGKSTFWTTAETFLLDEASARSGIGELVAELSEESSVRPSVRVCVVRGGTGQELLEQITQADELTALLDDAVRDGQAVDAPLYQALDDLLTDGIDAALPVLTLDENSVQVDGTAVFQGTKLSGYLSKEETALLALIRGDTEQITLYDAQKERYAFRDVSVKCSVDQTKTGKLLAQIELNVKLEGSTEQQSERAVQELIQDAVQLTDKLRALGSDVIGLGRVYQRSHPHRFSAKQWAEAYPSVPVKITATVERTQGGGTR